MKPALNLDTIRDQITNARVMCDIHDVDCIDIRLPSPYAPVTVHRDGAVIVTATGMRVFSLERR